MTEYMGYSKRTKLTPTSMVSKDKDAARNLASRIYEEYTADEVFMIAKLFALDARRLLETLTSKND